MNNEQVALIAAAILVNAWGDGDRTPGDVEQIAFRFTNWLERNTP